MGDSPSEDPPEGNTVLSRMVSAGIQALGSARRPGQPPGSALQRSAFTPGGATAPVSFIPSTSNSTISARPDPDGTRVEVAILSSHPHVRHSRGQARGDHFSLVGSISSSIQHQFHRLEDEFDAALRLTDSNAPPTPALPAAGSFPSIPNPGTHPSQIVFPGPLSHAGDELSLLDGFATPTATTPPTPESFDDGGDDMLGSADDSHDNDSLNEDDDDDEEPQVSTGHAPGTMSSSLTKMGTVPSVLPAPTLWVNTDMLPGAKLPWINRAEFFVQATGSDPKKKTRSYIFGILSSPNDIKWGMPVGCKATLTVHVKYDAKLRQHDSRLILIGASTRTKKIFGLRYNLDTGVKQVFPILLRGTSTRDLTIFHPFLHGYHGGPDHSHSSASNIYAVPVSWGGPQVVNTYALAWGLWADFKYRAGTDANVGVICSENAKPTRCDSVRAAQAFNKQFWRTHLRALGSDPYQRFRPPLPFYVNWQFQQFGEPDPHRWTTFHDLYDPDCGKVDIPGEVNLLPYHEVSTGLRYPRLVCGEVADCVPELDTPSVGASVHANSSGSLTSGGGPGRQESEATAYASMRLHTINYITKNKSFPIPQEPGKFPNWLLMIQTDMLGAPWSPGGQHILHHATTTPENATVSDSLATYLYRCGTNSTEQVQRNFFLQGEGHAYLKAKQGCELFQLLVRHYQPSGIRWLWQWSEEWAHARHEQCESIQTLYSRLEELSFKMKKAGIGITNKEFLLKLVMLACNGPYHTVFDHVKQKVCVNADKEWDLDGIAPCELARRLSDILRHSSFTDIKTDVLSRGSYPPSQPGASSSTPGAGTDPDTTGWEPWMGQKSLKAPEAAKTFIAFHCVVCHSRAHNLVDCRALQAAGYTVTKSDKGSSGGKGTTKGGKGKTPPSTTPGKTDSPVEPPKASTPSLRFAESTKPPATHGASTGVTPAASSSSKPISGRAADAASIGSLAEDSSSGTDEDLTWNAPNPDGVAAVEAARVRDNLASSSFNALPARKVRKTDMSGRMPSTGGRGGRGRGPGPERRTSRPNPLLSSLSAGSSDIWAPDSIARERNHNSTRTTYLCADSGASRDLFVQREWFIEYTDVRARDQYVVVADDTKVLIHGVGTVRFSLAGHEVLLRRVYHVPGLNGSLLSIRTHRRRGAGCTFLADHSGCFLTFPTFILTVDDEDDVVLPCGPSLGGELEYSQPATGFCPIPSHARHQASRIHSSCRRSRLADAAPHLIRPEPVSAKLDLDTPVDAVLPTHYVPESACAAESRYNTAELHRLFGCRRFDYSTLPYLGDGLHVTTDREPPLTIGDTVNINRGARGGPVPKPPRARHTIGADIGYGDGVGPGGYKYCLFLVDLATRYTWVYGLTDLSGECLTDALWRFFVDAGGFPKRFRCDFDRRFLHGKVGRLLRSHGVKIGASPPHRHSQNGAVERNWNTAVEMGRAFLAEANLPKRYWFWAVREATIRMNMLPVKSGPSLDDASEFQAFPSDLEDGEILSRGNLVRSSPSTGPSSPKKRRTRAKTAEAKARQWSTPMELYYGVRPDYRVLFKFGSIGYFRRTTESSGKSKSKFSSKSHFGIALGRSDYTNGMMFWDPTTSSFSVSADFRLDPDRGLGDPFPGIAYDGGMTPSLISGSSPPKEPFPPGCPAFALIDNDVYEGTVVSVPTPSCGLYQFLPTGSPDPIPVSPCDLCSPDDPIFQMDRNLDSSSELPTLPTWMQAGSHLTLESEGAQRKGYLGLSESGTWEFLQRDGVGGITYRIDLGDLPFTWRSRILDGSLKLGWASGASRAYHVHAGGLQRGVPGSFKLSMRKEYIDHDIWDDSYTEEYVGIRDKKTFSSLTWDDYQSKYRDIKIIPSMCVQTVKNDEVGVPLRAKSRIVALGNHEDTIWEAGDLYAPVIRKESDRLLTSIAVNMGRTQKQGDCKTAFLHPTLPPDEIVIVRPPPGCPFSAPGELWLLHKTLYGLRRSPKHWYDALCAALVFIGMTPLAHDPCVFTGTPIPGGPPLYLGVYVDDFTYFSASDEVERVFEAALSSQLTIDWMGEVGWYLGKAYEWARSPDGTLSVTLTQTAKIEAMLEDHQMSDCNPVRSPYRSGLVIDSIPHDGCDPLFKPDIVKPYQRLVGGLNWLSTSTRPDLCVAVSLLSQFSHNPSEGHLDAARYVLRYLQGTKDYGVRFTQNRCFTDHIEDWVHRPLGTSECIAFTDANWGPQDASHPPPDRVVHITEESVRSLLGHVLIRSGGPIAWGCMREPRTSHSSCQAEILAMDEGSKTIRLLRNIMHDLGLPDSAHPTPLYNDNRGSIDWSRGAALSKKLRHLNIREVCVRDCVRLSETTTHHIPGVFNVADIFTKEHKSAPLFSDLASQLIFPRLHSESLEDSSPDKENRPPHGGTSNRATMNTSQPHPFASLAKRGRIKGGAESSGLDSPACSVHTDSSVDLYILSG